MKKLFLLVLSAVLLTACQQTPQNVKDKYSSSQNEKSLSSTVNEFDINAEKVDVSQLDAYSEKLNDYIKQKGFDTNFLISDSLKINSAGELYNIKLKQVDNVHEKFPQVFEHIYKKDFAKLSGTSDVHNLTKVDTDHLVPGFKYVTSLIDYVMYDDLKTFSESHRQSDDHLTVGQTGFIYYVYDIKAETQKTADRVDYSCGESSDKQYPMFDGSECSPDEAKVYSEKYINDLFGCVTKDFRYIVSAIDVSMKQNGKYTFDVMFRKTFNSVPMTDLYIGQYNNTNYTKPMYYECTLSGKDKVIGVRAPYAFETVSRSEKITEKVIPVTQAVSILNKELAKNIKLEISEIKLMYYNEYDACAHEKAKRKSEEGAQLTTDEQLELMYPYWSKKREYNCYPVWAFYMPRSTSSNKDEFSSARLYDYILVNALTGEVINYIDCGSSY